MAKKYFIVEDENGNEIAREEVKDKEQKSFIERVKDFPKDFAEKHPKVTKGLKIGGIATAVIGSGVIAYKLGNRNGESDNDSDDMNYIPESEPEPTCLPFDDSSESETTDASSEEEATTTE